jgi:hypothetical protein
MLRLALMHHPAGSARVNAGRPDTHGEASEGFAGWAEHCVALSGPTPARTFQGPEVTAESRFLVTLGFLSM